MEGYRNAGFFEIGNSIYSHYCDSHGNMVRIRFDQETKTWKKFKYEQDRDGVLQLVRNELNFQMEEKGLQFPP